MKFVFKREKYEKDEDGNVLRNDKVKKNKVRIKKNDRELLLEEIDIFDSLMKKFASDIKENYD